MNPLYTDNQRRPLQERIYWNEKLKCKAKGCNRNRSRVSGFCTTHNNKNFVYGSPYHQRLSRGMYAQELKEVKAILGKNLDQHHKGVLFALEAIGKWLDQSANNCQTPPGYLHHLYRLRAHGVTAYKVLCECAALYLFNHRYSDYIHDRRHLIHVLGLRVLRLTPHKGEVFTGKMHRESGQALFDRVGILLVTVAHAAERVKQDERYVRQLLSAPLAMPESVGGAGQC